MKKRSRIINITFAVILVLTLLTWAALLIYQFNSLNNMVISEEDKYVSYFYSYRFSFILSVLLFLPIILIECDIFFDMRYFIQPKSYRPMIKSILNVIACILSCLTVFSLFPALAQNDVELFLIVCFYYICAYIPLRIIYVICLLILNRRERKYFLDT